MPNILSNVTLHASGFDQHNGRQIMALLYSVGNDETLGFTLGTIKNGSYQGTYTDFNGYPLVIDYDVESSYSSLVFVDFAGTWPLLSSVLNFDAPTMATTYALIETHFSEQDLSFFVMPENFGSFNIVTYHPNYEGSQDQPVQRAVFANFNFVTLDVFKREGFTLINWNTVPDRNGGVEYSIYSSITEDIDLYAQWAPATKLSFELIIPEDGSDPVLSPSDITVAYGQAFTLTAPEGFSNYTWELDLGYGFSEILYSGDNYEVQLGPNSPSPVVLNPGFWTLTLTLTDYNYFVRTVYVTVHVLQP